MQILYEEKIEHYEKLIANLEVNLKSVEERIINVENKDDLSLKNELKEIHSKLNESKKII